VIDRSDIRPILLGHFTIPDDGDPRAGEKVVVSAYLIDHTDGRVLLDTGIAEGHEETERLYHPARRSLDAGLASAGSSVEDVRVVVNCHFHIDHCGNNPRFAGTPIFAQQTEFDSAHDGEDYPIPELYDFEGVKFELHGGEADVADGIRIVPTPGHTPGHQSLVVETRQGRVVLAGQAVNGATDFARAHFAQVLFAHDTASWHRDR
jgi:N-acyl homoserine lactone hydrolase